ncbi:MAG: hypothetical protein QM699_16565 [Amaricoccus sp.]|uniref:ImuA family protein n=1 Tax=Amaricoccus sp. TaxID=1872485 RepID=UPI0039E3E0D2
MCHPAAPPRLLSARVHEAQGPGAVGFAAMQAAGVAGRLVWLRPEVAAAGEVLPAGLARFLAPERLVRVTAGSEAELLWATEEVLRAGVAGLVVAEPQRPLGLTAGRRLQLAAEAGGSPGLLLIRDGAGSPAAETRWQVRALAGDTPDSTRAEWALIRNKKGTLGAWTVEWDDATHSVTVVSAAGERLPAAARAP